MGYLLFFLCRSIRRGKSFSTHSRTISDKFNPNSALSDFVLSAVFPKNPVLWWCGFDDSLMFVRVFVLCYWVCGTPCATISYVIWRNDPMNAVETPSYSHQRFISETWMDALPSRELIPRFPDFLSFLDAGGLSSIVTSRQFRQPRRRNRL